MSNANKTFYNQMLKTNICEVVFTKNDGSERTMKCSLLPSIFTQFNISESTGTSKVQNDDQVNVIDIDVGDWRSFKISAVKSFKVISATFTNMLSNVTNRIANSQFAGFQQNVKTDPPIDIKSMYTTQTNRTQFYLNMLRQHICNITFMKANGDIREMNATLLASYIQDHNLAPHQPSSDIMTDNDTIRVVDTDIDEWRTFKISKLLSFKTPSTEQSATQSVVAQPKPSVVRETTLTTVI